MRAYWTVSLVALLLGACSGGSAERNRGGAGVTPEPRAGATAPDSAPASTPAAPRPSPVAGPDLSYSVLIPESEDEVPIRWTSVFTGTPRTRLEGGELWAPAAAVARVLAPQSRVSFEAGSLKVDGKAVTVPARLENGEPWAAVAPLARHFGALARVREPEGSVSLWTRDALVWLRDNNSQSPVLQEARAAGLLTDG
jgi:hypothetical protein